jgi:hypothetical protein
MSGSAELTLLEELATIFADGGFVMPPWRLWRSSCGLASDTA